MATTIKLISKVVNQDGSIAVTFADGNGLSFNNEQDYLDFVGTVDDNVDLTYRICLAIAEARNISVVLNKNFTFDVTEAQPIKIN